MLEDVRKKERITYSFRSIKKMVRVLCNCCNKRIKEMKRLRTCTTCGKPVCFSCRIRSECRDCVALSSQDALVYDYFRDKYENPFMITGDINGV